MNRLRSFAQFAALLLAVAGCDPGYERVILFDPVVGGRTDGTLKGDASDKDRDARVLAAADAVARRWDFTPGELDHPRRGEEILRRYLLHYQPDKRRNRWKNLMITVRRWPARRTMEVALIEMVTSRESPKFRQIFDELRRRLPDGRAMRSNWGDGGGG